MVQPVDPPTNLEAEITAVGSCFYGKTHFNQIKSVMRPEMLYEPIHRMIYAAMLEVGADVCEENLGVVKVFEALKSKGLGETVGMHKITQIFISVMVPERGVKYARIVRDKWLSRQMIDLGTGLASQDKRPPEDVIDTLRGAVKELGAEMLSEALVHNLTESTGDRIKRYEDMGAFEGGVNGVPTPFPTMDLYTQGFQKGELTTVMAPQGTGKTFFLILEFLKAYRAGVRPLLVSMEMQPTALMRRFDAMYAGVPLDDLRRGELDHWAEQRYRESMDELSKGDPLYIVGGSAVRTVDDLEVLVDQLDPGIVLVDSFYFMKPTKDKKDKWEKVGDVFEGLRMQSRDLERPYIISSQFNRKVRAGHTQATGQDAGFSYEISQGSDIIIGMFQDEDMKANKKMIFQLIKNREGNQEEMIVNWDFDKMDFSEPEEVELDLGQEGEPAVAAAREEEEIPF